MSTGVTGHCTTCGTVASSSGSVSSAYPGQTAAPTSCGCKNTAPSIVDQCHTIASSVIQPCLTLKSGGNMPACGATAELVFDENVSKFCAGIDIFSNGIGYLRVEQVKNANTLLVRNLCGACQVQSSGGALPAGSKWSWGMPNCGGLVGVQDVDGACLASPGFIFPPALGYAIAKVNPNTSSFILGETIQFAGFNWRVDAIIDVNTLRIQNPSNGSVPYTEIEWDANNDGECDYPITKLTTPDACGNSPATTGKPLLCVAGELKPATGVSRADTFFFNPVSGDFDVKSILGPIENIGPHYINVSALDGSYTLEYCPNICGDTCSQFKCSLELTPLNTTGIYNIEMNSVTPFTIFAPNNRATVGGREFVVIGIDVPQKKLALQVTQPVLVSETLPAGTNLCVREGCQPFDAANWAFPQPLNPTNPLAGPNGTRIFCSDRGLVGVPAFGGNVGEQLFADPADINITAVGVYARAEHQVNIINPSAFRKAVVMVHMGAVSELSLPAGGKAYDRLYIGIGGSPGLARDNLRTTPAGTTGPWEFTSETAWNFGTIINPGATLDFRLHHEVATTEVFPSTALWKDSKLNVQYTIVIVNDPAV